MSAAVKLNELVRFTIEVVKGPHAGLKKEFDKVSITIGRGPENEIVLADDPRISRQHAEIRQVKGEFFVLNLSQKNFVLVNGTEISHEKISNQSLMQVGESELKLTIHGSTALLSPVAPLVPNGTVVPIQGRGKPVPQAPPPLPKVNYGGGAPTAVPRPQSGPLPPPRPMPSSAGDSSKMKIYVILGIVVLGLFFFLSKNGKSRRVEDKAFRTSEELDLSRQESENAIKKFQERQDKMNQEIYKKAYENFLRGYRDYRQGQYLRARETFQVVLNLDPENELARRYWNLSKIRFDEMIKMHMLQGRRYLEKGNYRMCAASFQTVMSLLGNDQSNGEYSEARQLHKQCKVALEGRF